MADRQVNCRLYDSSRTVPVADWQRVTGDDLDLDLRLLGVVEEALAGQCRLWFALLDDGGAPVAAAALALFHVDAVLTAKPVVQQVTGAVRKAWPGCLRLGVVFCGLPVPAGADHLRILPGADRAAVLRALDRTMRQLGGRLLVFKEISDARLPEFSALEGFGYRRGAVPPLHLLDARFRSFDEYCAALKSRYRNQVTRSLKKFERAGYRVVYADDVERSYTDAVHRLYEAVWERAPARLEKFPATFFRQLARALPGRTSLTLLCRDDRVAAFTFGLWSDRVYHSLYAGLDYALNAEADLYFNLFYRDLDRAFRRGFAEIHLGQTSDDFKARLGCEPQPRWFYARACGRVWQAGLNIFAGAVFPQSPAVERYDVFHREHGLL